MIKYIIRDLTETIQYLPFGVIVGLVTAVFVYVLNAVRRRAGKKPVPLLAVTCLMVYSAIIFSITFWSRESGSRNKIDLELFSTWGINNRNNAYVIENVLLFIPYGYILSWNWKPARNVFVSLVVGLLTSLGIETMQLVTERGFFQVDDVLTNTLGMVIGTCLFFLLCGWRKKT